MLQGGYRYRHVGRQYRTVCSFYALGRYFKYFRHDVSFYNIIRKRFQKVSFFQKTNFPNHTHNAPPQMKTGKFLPQFLNIKRELKTKSNVAASPKRSHQFPNEELF